MNRYIIFISLFTLLACSERNSLKQFISDKLKYTLIRDNLYRDDAGNLYLKAVNHEDIDHGTTYNVWLTTVYCDTCTWEHTSELKDFVDVSTFHYDTTYENEGVVIYADKKYSYRHKLMADGGTITLEKK